MHRNENFNNNTTVQINAGEKLLSKKQESFLRKVDFYARLLKECAIQNDHETAKGILLLVPKEYRKAVIKMASDK